MGNTMQFSLMSPEKTIYKGEVVSVTSQNKTGPFDILLHHENFICIVFGQLKVKELSGKWVSLPIDKAVLMVANDVVKVFTGLRK